MSIHILVPQERLAELLKTEKLAQFSSLHEETAYPDEYVARCEEINDLLKTKEGLANHLGYEYAVSTDAAYFESLEDVLDAEE